jgi:hypothetical protein
MRIKFRRLDHESTVSLKPTISTIIFATVALVIIAGATPQESGAQNTLCETGNYPVTKIGTRKPIESPYGSFPAGVTTREVPAAPLVTASSINYVRVLIEAQRADCNWFVTVRDKDYHVIQTLTRADFPRRLRWTRRVPGPKAIVELQGCKGVSASQIKLNEMIFMESESRNTYYSTKVPGVFDWKDLYADTASLTMKPVGNYRSLGDHVGFIMSSSGSESWVCSGVLITKDLLLTNWHCGGPDPDVLAAKDFWNTQIINDTIIDFSFDDDKTSREYMILERVGNNSYPEFIDRDFVLLRIAPLEFQDTLRPVAISTARLISGQRIQMVHHPNGKPKQISFGCTVIDEEYGGWQKPQIKTEFTHQCDTERGSSGGAIFNLNGQLIGLHHLGYDASSGQCDRKNKAISMRAIVEFLQAKFPSIAAELNTTP